MFRSDQYTHSVNLWPIRGYITQKTIKSWYPFLESHLLTRLTGYFLSMVFIIYLTGVSAWSGIKHRLHICQERSHLLYPADSYAGHLLYHQLIGAALIEMIFLLAAILVNGIVFYKIDKTAGLLYILTFMGKFCNAAYL
ncbi:hypothetical protein CS542_01370 [Pedobacter sp. IW39]|nr:hypothetical protein CS542_01370 [Pedobacter sp. IW39]